MFINVKLKATVTFIAFFHIILAYIIVQHSVDDSISLVTELDILLPFVPIFVWPYISLFPVTFLTFVLLVKRHFVFKIAIISSIIALAISIFFYLMLPSMYLLRPDIHESDSLSLMLCSLIYQYDLTNNSFPSLHVAYACILYLVTQISVYSHLVWLRLSYMLWMMLVILSTLLIKQHHIIDVLGGILVALASFKVSTFLVRRSDAKKS